MADLRVFTHTFSVGIPVPCFGNTVQRSLSLSLKFACPLTRVRKEAKCYVWPLTKHCRAGKRCPALHDTGETNWFLSQGMRMPLPVSMFHNFTAIYELQTVGCRKPMNQSQDNTTQIKLSNIGKLLRNLTLSSCCRIHSDFMKTFCSASTSMFCWRREILFRNF